MCEGGRKEEEESHLIGGSGALFWPDRQLPSREALLLPDGLEHVLLGLVWTLLLRLLHHGLLWVLHACDEVGVGPRACVCFPTKQQCS